MPNNDNKNNNLIPQFIPDNSAVARKLDNMSDQELFERYFVPTNNPNWDIRKDASDVVNVKIPKTEKYKYAKTVSVSGEPLDYFVAVLSNRLNTYIPNGYKLNMLNIIEDFENILIENSEQARDVSRTKKVNRFLYDVTRYFVDLCNLGLDYILADTANQ